MNIKPTLEVILANRELLDNIYLLVSALNRTI